MTRRLAAAVAAATVLAAPALATAKAAPPQIVDPSGDAAGMQASLDIVSVRFGTTGKTTVTKAHGKKKTVYTPSKLVITQTLAAAPSETAGVRYRVESFIDGCGNLDLYYTNAPDGPVGTLWLDCPEGAGVADGGTLVDLLPKVSGKTMTWEVSLKMLPKEARTGAVMSHFRAFTDVAEPAMGLVGSGDGASNILVLDDDPTSGAAVADVATGSGTWKIG